MPTPPKSQVIDMNSISTTPESTVSQSFTDLFGAFPGPDTPRRQIQQH